MVSQYAKLKGIILTAKKNPRIVKISGLTESICSIYIQKVKEALRKSHPEIHPKLFDVDYQNTFDSLRDNRFDIGFEPYSELAEVDDLNSIPIAKEQAFLIVEKNSHFAEKDCVNFAEIECLDFVTIRNNAGFALRKHIQSACHRRGLHGAIPNEFILSQGKDHGSLLLEGLGGMATMLPESLVQSHHPIFKERYCAIPIVDNDLYYDFRIFWKESASKEVLLYIKTLESVMTSPLVQPTASTASTPSTPSPDLNPENTTG
jgi:DNA-binding transcriptional LysR family regulator